MSDQSLVPILHKRDLHFVLGALMMGMFLSALDSTIVSTALPTIVGDLHGASHLSWVVVAYLLATTVTTPLWGKLGDLHGRKGYFQASIVIFLVGSMMCGIAHSMTELVAFRAFQGLGSGGLMVGAQAVMADVIPPRERGKYAGWFGAVFGTSTIVGPLLGGVLVDYTSWRWIFFVNLPLGIAALAACAAYLPSSKARVQHTIDYAGIFTLSLSATALILFTSLGGISFPWGSWKSIALAVGGVLAAIVCIFIERKSVEPIFAPRLFKNKVFLSASAIGFVVGFAMYGAMVFLPLYYQDVRLISPTMSGLRLIPMMAGLFATSIFAGQMVSKGKKYRPFPITGTALMTVGLGLFSFIGVATSSWLIAFFMLVFGMGLGLVMQILTTAVQNAVLPEDIGAGTAGSNFFRSMGGSFGTAVFGALFANQLPKALAADVKGLPAGASAGSASSWTPQFLQHLPKQVFNEIAHALSTTIAGMYIWSIPFGLLALALSFTLPELKLRKSITPHADEVPMSTDGHIL
jgi:EmrB/QacA subfamily drug resistance transporter